MQLEFSGMQSRQNSIFIDVKLHHEYRSVSGKIHFKNHCYRLVDIVHALSREFGIIIWPCSHL